MKPYTITFMQLLVSMTMTVTAAKNDYDPYSTFVMCAAWTVFGFAFGACLSTWLRTRK